MVPVDITLGASSTDNTLTSKDSFNVEMHEINEGGKPKEFEITISQNDGASPQVELASGDNDHDGDVGGMEQKADPKKPKKIKVTFIMPQEVEAHANNNWSAAVDMFYKYWIDQLGNFIIKKLANSKKLDQDSLKSVINKAIINKDLINAADKQAKEEQGQIDQNSLNQGVMKNSSENSPIKKKLF